MSIRSTALALAAGAALSAALPSTAMANGSPGAVYALSNAPGGNAVVAFSRDRDGALTPAGSFATGGNGSGGGLGSQGAVIVSDNERFVLAVNAGSNSVSSLRIMPGGGLQLVDTAPSGGVMPTSVAARHGLVYVLNAGAPNSVSGLRIDERGGLTPIAGSARALSAAVTNPAQVSFDANGDAIVVTERATNRIDSFAVQQDGSLGDLQVQPSAGPTPFGFAVSKRNTLFVSEAGAGGGASTYAIGGGGALAPVSANLMTGQRAACWAVVTDDGRFGYVTNAGTGNVSGFAIGNDGAATLLDADGVTAATGGNPTDAALSKSSRYLYVRVAALSQIAAFAIGDDGGLHALPAIGGTQAGLVGLAAL